MRLNPKEQEKLMLHMAGELAKQRKDRGLKLNYVEAIAFISSELLERARDGKTVAELMSLGTKLLSKTMLWRVWLAWYMRFRLRQHFQMVQSW